MDFLSPGATRSAFEASACADVRRAILAHPFLSGLADGTLPIDRFQLYIQQDSLYLKDFARVLARIGTRLPEPGAVEIFCRHASTAVAVEQALHGSFQSAWETPAAFSEPTPTTVLYTSWLLRMVNEADPVLALAAVLPCYAIYLEVGQHLENASPGTDIYQSWIDLYGGEEFAEAVREVTALLDRLCVDATNDIRAQVESVILQGTRLEYLFWDAAWRKETWPAVEAGT
jgi:thiaminase/transcriptional activator TenA